MGRRMIGCAAALLIVATMAACDQGTRVGEDLTVDKSPGSGGGPRLGDRPASPSPNAQANSPAPASPQADTKAPSPPPATAAAVVKIQSDTSGGTPFDPRQVQVSRGSIVRWENTDSVARSVIADGGAFRSPDIPPGGSWEYRANTPGDYNYHDGTRPYAVGSLVVT